MPGDFSRKTFNKQKHYSGVLMQQGRVQLDADWNEQLDIAQHRTGTETKDVIGPCGVPKLGGFFNITAAANGSDLAIAPGHMYVGGLLCELETSIQAASYLAQPYYPNPDKSFFTNAVSSPPQSPPEPQSKLKDGIYIVYIDAWQREQNYLDDRLMHEVALGEADTAARLQTVWQVRLLTVAGAGATCKTTFQEWNDLLVPPSGKLNVQTIRVEDPKNPCILPPQAGYKRLENQLYRVEVQNGGSNRAGTTFKWSRDNASVETTIEKITGAVVTVSSMGRDDVLGFKTGQWVELTDEESDLKSSPKPLVKILAINTAKREITLDTPAIVNTDDNRIKLRRWDQEVAAAGADGIATTGWIDLEDGIQVLFSEGSYHAGDYWLIPARTATAEVEWPPYDLPNLTPEPQSPLGIKHHYCKLALLQVAAGTVTVQDCRPLFPSLTEICAADICFDNEACNFEEANNVQEALDLLCAANDLRSHHRYLHGFGVVCGLKVRCRAIRTGVIIEKGRALDCDGNWIEVKAQNGQVYDLVENAKKGKLLDEKGSGTVCLSIARGSNKTAVISIEPYVPRNFWDTVLEGTLLKDFYEECIENLFLFLKNQAPFPLTDEAPVPVTQRRLTAFLNLFAQLINSASGPYGFISGGKGEENNDQPTEDQLLRQFYNDLKAQVASETFCALFDGDRPFPDYDLDRGLSTVFGPAFKFHHRLRLHPSGKVGYTCGKNNRVYVYNLVTNELAHTLPFPAAANIIIQDIAISEKGDELYAVGVLNNQDSVFAIAAINDKSDFSWGATSFVAGIKFVTLATGPSNRLYAIAKARGFYAINAIGSAAFTAQQVAEFNATGLVTISARGQVAAANADAVLGTETDVFSFLIIFLASGNGITGKIALSGDDGLNDVIMHNEMIFATGNSVTGQRILGGFNAENGQPQTTETVLNETSAIRLGAYVDERFGNFLLLAIADKFKVTRVRIRGEKLEPDSGFSIPVQLFPMSVAVSSQTQKAYVLNMVANTLTAINMPIVFDNQKPPDYTSPFPTELAAYRDDAIAAYRDVLSHLLQYLKDCFCDKFLVDCPECTEKDKVYLGCVEVRNNQVYHICNFSGRTYVKSFRTVEYWLSTIPILPIAKEAFTKLCCTVFENKRSQEANTKP